MTDSRPRRPDGPRPGREAQATWRGRRVLVVGAGGFLGRWVARALTREGAQPLLTARAPERLARERDAWEIGGTIVARDLLDDGLEEWVASCAPEVIVNCAGYGVDRDETDASRSRRLNADLPGRLAVAATRLPPSDWPGVRLLHVGSALEYGSYRGVLREDGPTESHTAYGRDKLAGTRAVAEAAVASGCPMLVVRLFTLFGAGEHATRLLPTLRRAARARTSVQLSSGWQQRDFLPVDEVADGLLALGVAGPALGPIVNLAAGRLRTVREFATTAAGVLGIAGPDLRFGDVEVRPDEMAPAGVAVERLHAATEWRPTGDLGAAIARMAAWSERLGE